MAATSITVSELPTADEDPESWNVLWVAGLPVPGICLPIDGERRRAVDHSKAKGSSKDIVVDNGLDPTECTVRIRTTSGAVFRDLYDFFLKYMDPNRPLTRLNTVSVASPQLYSRGIKLGYFFQASLPKPTSDTGIRPMISEFRFKIIGPRTQISANSGSSKPKQSNLVAGPTDPNFKKRGGAVTQISTSPVLLPGVSSTAKPQPAAQKATSLTPTDVQKAGNAGDPSAKFVDRKVSGAAP